MAKTQNEININCDETQTVMNNILQWKTNCKEHKLWWNQNLWLWLKLRWKTIYDKTLFTINTKCDRIFWKKAQVVKKHGLWWHKKCNYNKIEIKHRLWWNTNCDKRQIKIKKKTLKKKLVMMHKLWWNTSTDETQIMTQQKFRQIYFCDNTNFNKK